jgi:hypothetical protein
MDLEQRPKFHDRQRKNECQNQFEAHRRRLNRAVTHLANVQANLADIEREQMCLARRNRTPAYQTINAIPRKRPCKSSAPASKKHHPIHFA